MTFTPLGDWLRSDDGRYRISRMDLHVGRVYTAYAIDPPGDWGPVFIGNEHSAERARRLCETHDSKHSEVIDHG